ncbi:hypothetical protein Leryth_012273 [Lithospermum erythrorhizon]|nr:hypothetical protein Leryth_012273 [Lithospermum erythrorhizon]
MDIWKSLTDNITLYTGLSPTTFFTIITLMVVTYKVISGMFVSNDDNNSEVKEANEFVYREPVQLKIFTLTKPLMFYGPGGPYALFAGRESSRALALMSFDAKDLNGNLEGLSPSELEVLQDWEYKFMEKYVKVGQLVQEKPSNRKLKKPQPDSLKCH